MKRERIPSVVCTVHEGYNTGDEILISRTTFRRYKIPKCCDSCAYFSLTLNRTANCELKSFKPYKVISTFNILNERHKDCKLIKKEKT